MTMMDFTLDDAEQQPSVDVKHSRIGYRVREVKLDGWRSNLARLATTTLCIGLVAAAGMVWTLSDANFASFPMISKAILSLSLFVVAAILFLNGVYPQKTDEVQVDKKGRVLHVVSRGPYQFMRTRKTFRFEEITRIDLDGSNLMSELRSAWTRWDYGCVTLSAHGNQRVNLFGGDMMDLEPLLRRLRADTGVA